MLDSINFEISRGEFVCIVGGSGCGKSTLLRLMSGLDPDYEGQVIIDHELVKRLIKEGDLYIRSTGCFLGLQLKKT